MRVQGNVTSKSTVTLCGASSFLHLTGYFDKTCLIFISLFVFLYLSLGYLAGGFFVNLTTDKPYVKMEPLKELDMKYEVRVADENVSDSLGYEAQVIAEKKGLIPRRIGLAILKTFDVDPQGKIDGAVELQVVATDRKYQGRGVGRAVVEEAINLAKNRGADRVELDSVDSAVDFYRKLGFTLEDRRTGKMVRRLENPADVLNDAA